MASPIDRQRLAQTYQARDTPSSTKIGAEAKKIDSFIQENYPAVHSMDSRKAFEDSADQLYRGNRQINVGGDERENLSIPTPHDPRVSGN